MDIHLAFANAVMGLFVQFVNFSANATRNKRLEIFVNDFRKAVVDGFFDDFVASVAYTFIGAFFRTVVLEAAIVVIEYLWSEVRLIL